MHSLDSRKAGTETETETGTGTRTENWKRSSGAVLVCRVYVGITRQSILWDIHTNKINVEVANYWVIVLYVMRFVIC